MEVHKLNTKGLIVQTLSGIAIGFLAIQTGFVYAWPSFNLANFTSNKTVLDTPMSTMHVSLLGSLPNLGGLLTTPLWGWIYSSLGRKYGTLLFGLPYVIAWLIISLTTNVALVLVAVAIAGAGVAGQNISIMYISEIAHVSIRGTLTAIASTGFMAGLLLAYIMGGYFAYTTLLMINLSVSVLTIVFLACLRESPVFLVLVGKEEEAAKSVSFYRHLDVNSEAVRAEVHQIKRSINPKLESLLLAENEDDKIVDRLIEKLEENKEKESMSPWKFLLKSKSSKRIFVIMLIILALTILTGGVILQVYAEPLFNEAAPSISPNQCAIFSGLDALVASLTCMSVIDRFGRKSILMTTTAVSGVCTGLLGLQLQLNFAPHWFTVALINVYSFAYTAGAATIPFVLLSEIFLPEVGSFCNAVCYCFVWAFYFVTLSVFPPIVESLGLGSVFYIFCIMSFVSTAFVQFYLPETKGLSVDKIQALFLKQSRRKSKVTKLERYS